MSPEVQRMESGKLVNDTNKPETQTFSKPTAPAPQAANAATLSAVVTMLEKPLEMLQGKAPDDVILSGQMFTNSLKAWKANMEKATKK